MSRILLGVITIWFSKMLDLKKLENIGMTNIARICIKIREKNDRSFLKFLLFCFTYLCSSKQGESALIEARKIHDKYVLLNVLCPDVLVLTAKEFKKKKSFCSLPYFCMYIPWPGIVVIKKLRFRPIWEL